MTHPPFALLSDIHGNLPALEAVAADLERNGIRQVLTLGDHVSGPLWPRETAEFLMAQPWRHLAGNHERQLFGTPLGPSDLHARRALGETHLQWLAGLPTAIQQGEHLLACHGSPRSDLEYLLETVEHGRVRLATPEELAPRLQGVTATLLVCGHTHVPRVVQWGATLLVNPGSVGCPAYEDTQPTPHRVETGSPRAWYARVEERGGTWHASLISVAYDHDRAAAQAAQSGRPEWASALRTGYLPRP